VRIGHINLATSFNGTGEHFVSLVEALEQVGVKQHVLVRNTALARRVGNRRSRGRPGCSFGHNSMLPYAIM